jgi:G3E family GTPase
MKAVTVDVVTGFLGSGKTTLIKHVLEKGLQGRRVAVVVNEIGDLNLDGRIIEGVNVDKMVELSNGCICCSISYQFGYAMQEIVETTKPELIVIETSGAADPGPLVEEVRAAGLRVDAVITVVDGEQIQRFCKENVVARHQLEAADFLVLNKRDLLTPRDFGRVERWLGRYNRRALVVPTEFGRVSTDLLFATGVRRFRDEAAATGRSASHDHLGEDEIQAFTYETEAPLDRKRFERFLARLPHELYRAKGILCFSGDDWNCIFNYTCGRYDIDWFVRKQALGAKSQAVFIGKGILRKKELILAELADCQLREIETRTADR